MYIRFVVGTEQEKLNRLHGPFAEARILRDKEVLYEYEVYQINQIFDWFNENMPCPPFSESKWPNNAVAWFKISSQEFISKMYEINAILLEHNVQIRVIKEKYTGKILYEDDFQIVSVSGKY